MPHSEPARTAGSAGVAIGRFTPRLSVFAERVLCTDDDTEVDLPMLTVVFDYGGVEVRASDRRERFFVATSRGTELVARDRKGEAEAQCVLESFGAIELDCVERYVPSLDCAADYVVHVEDNVHAYFSYSAHAVPRLKTLGWDVTIAED